MRLITSPSEDADRRSRKQFRQTPFTQIIGGRCMPVRRRHGVCAGYKVVFVDRLERIEVTHALRGLGIGNLNVINAWRKDFCSQFLASMQRGCGAGEKEIAVQSAGEMRRSKETYLIENQFSDHGPSISALRWVLAKDVLAEIPGLNDGAWGEQHGRDVKQFLRRAGGHDVFLSIVFLGASDSTGLEPATQHPWRPDPNDTRTPICPPDTISVNRATNCRPIVVAIKRRFLDFIVQAHEHHTQQIVGYVFAVRHALADGAGLFKQGFGFGLFHSSTVGRLAVK